MEITPTRSALLESRDERVVMREGYRFLDEKRLLLASEIIRQYTRYRALHTDFLECHDQSVAALVQSVSRHGLHALQVAPVEALTDARIHRQERVFFGVALIDTPTIDPPLVSEENNPDPCAQAFTAQMALSVELAALSGNLNRLLIEYQRTERRARALEDVILPELDGAIHEMEIRLEELEQEEAVRVRLRRA